jgi:hypothetical protein
VASRRAASSACWRSREAHGPALTEDAAHFALEAGAPSYRFLRRYLERVKLPATALKQIDPLIRQLTALPRPHRTASGPNMNLVELDRALRKLRLSGMADVLETRLRHAQAERLPPLDLIAMLVNDELQRRQDRLLERRRVQARFRDPESLARCL